MEAPKPEKRLSRDQIEKKVKSTMDEYVSSLDAKEAVACIVELKCPEEMALVVETILMHVLERSPTARDLAGRLLLDLVREGHLSLEHLVKGSVVLLAEEAVDDFVVDVPCLFKYLGEIFGGLISSSGHFPLKQFNQFADSLGRHFGKFLAASLKHAEKSLGPQTLASCWQAEELSLEQMLGPDAADLIEKNDLRFLTASATAAANSSHIPSKSSTSSSSSSSSRAPLVLSQFSKELENRLRRDLNDDDIQMWIHDQVGEDMIKDPSFIRALMTAAISV